MIDGTQAQVIDWVVAHPGVELVMGTNNSALAQGGYGDPWSAGLMTQQGLHRRLGNDADRRLRQRRQGQDRPQGDPPRQRARHERPAAERARTSTATSNSWIPNSFDNLKASLAAAGLGSIPISTTIANYGATNEVSVKIPAHIVANWGSAWNNGEPFVLFNQYTPDNQQSTDFDAVETYFEAVAKALGTKLEVFVGETGYSDDWGAANQAKVLTEMFAWLGGQRTDSGGKTVPLFLFDAFDRPAYPAGEIGFGVYGENGKSQPTGRQDRPLGRDPRLDRPGDHHAVQEVGGALRMRQARGHDQGARRRRHRARAGRGRQAVRPGRIGPARRPRAAGTSSTAAAAMTC